MRVRLLHEALSPCSSIGQSVGVLTPRLEVQILLGALAGSSMVEQHAYIMSVEGSSPSRPTRLV